MPKVLLAKLKAELVALESKVVELKALIAELEVVNNLSNKEN